MVVFVAAVVPESAAAATTDPTANPTAAATAAVPGYSAAATTG